MIVHALTLFSHLLSSFGSSSYGMDPVTQLVGGPDSSGRFDGVRDFASRKWPGIASVQASNSGPSVTTALLMPEVTFKVRTYQSSQFNRLVFIIKLDFG